MLDEGGVAVEDLTAADLNGDGKIDIIAVGRADEELPHLLEPGEVKSWALSALQGWPVVRHGRNPGQLFLRERMSQRQAPGVERDDAVARQLAAGPNGRVPP